MIVDNLNDSRVIEALSTPGGVIASLTDTTYGLLARADSPKSLKRLYEIRKRSPRQSTIVLVASVSDIPGLTGGQMEIYQKLLEERPTTIVLKTLGSILPHLPRTDNTLAFRAVRHKELAKLISQVGPLLAPSANYEGEPPATNIHEAIAYFGDKIDIYVDGGENKNALSSKIIAIKDGDEIEVIRE